MTCWVKHPVIIEVFSGYTTPRLFMEKAGDLYRSQNKKSQVEKPTAEHLLQIIIDSNGACLDKPNKDGC